MRTKTLLACLTLLAAACGGDTAATTTSPDTTVGGDTSTTSGSETTTTSAAEGGAQFVLTAVAFGDGQMVVITNVGDAPGTMAGHFLCQRPNYFRIPDVDLEPGQSLAIGTGGNGFTPPEGAITVDATAEIGGLSATGGEVGLYTSSDFSNADAILSYVEWGSSGHARAGTAVDAGVWDGGFVATGADTASLQANTDRPQTAGQWDAS